MSLLFFPQSFPPKRAHNSSKKFKLNSQTPNLKSTNLMTTTATIQTTPFDMDDTDYLSKTSQSIQSRRSSSLTQSIQKKSKLTIDSSTRSLDLMDTKLFADEFNLGISTAALLFPTIEDIDVIVRLRQIKILEEYAPPSTDQDFLTIKQMLMESRELLELRQKEAILDKLNSARISFIEKQMENHRKLVSDRRKILLRNSKIRNRETTNRRFLLADNHRRLVCSKIETYCNNLHEIADSSDGSFEFFKANCQRFLSLSKSTRPNRFSQESRSKVDPLKNDQKSMDMERRNFHEIATNLLKTRLTDEAILSKFMLTPDEQNALSGKTDHRHKKEERSSNLGHQQLIIPGGGNQQQQQQKSTGLMDRVETPRVIEKILNSEEPLEFGTIHLVRLLRGSAVRADMLSAMEKNRDVIDYYLNLSNAVTEDVQDEQSNELLSVEQSVHKIVAQTAYKLNLELSRRTEENRIWDLMKTALIDRHEREEVEITRRRAEIDIRDKNEEIFANVIKVNRASASTFLDTVFNNLIQVKTDLSVKEVLKEKQAITNTIIEKSIQLEKTKRDDARNDGSIDSQNDYVDTVSTAIVDVMVDEVIPMLNDRLLKSDCDKAEKVNESAATKFVNDMFGAL